MLQLNTDRPDVTVQVVDFAPTVTSMREQLRLVRASRVLAGFHGAGLVHLMFMHPEASVLEFTLIRYWTRTHFSNVARNLGATMMAHCLDISSEVDDGYTVPPATFVKLVNMLAPLEEG